MPNVETEGALVGLYCDVSGTQTLVAAKRGLDVEESSDSIDMSHSDNRVAPIEVTNIGSSDVTVKGDRRREINAHPEFELRNTPNDDGVYEATGTSLSGGNTVISVSATLSGGSPGNGRALIVAPYGFIERVPGQQDWNASFDGVLLLDDATGSFEASHDALRDAKRNQNTILTQVRYPNTDGSNPRDEARALVSSMTLTAPYDGAATIAIELDGAEPLVYAN
jgi:predicted secreted protein